MREVEWLDVYDDYGSGYTPIPTSSSTYMEDIFYLEIKPQPKAMTLEEVSYYTGWVYLDRACIFQYKYENVPLRFVKRQLWPDCALNRMSYWKRIRNELLQKRNNNVGNELG